MNFQCKKTDPILQFHIKDLKENWKELEKHLNPEFVKNPHLKDFKWDMGLFIMRFGIEENFYEPICFPMEGIAFIAKLEDNLYSINCNFGTYITEGGIQKLAGSFDFDEVKYQELLQILPQQLKTKISDSLKRQPFRYVDIPTERFDFNMYAVLSINIHHMTTKAIYHWKFNTLNENKSP
ncbi:hypothetical protein EV144_1011419 [Flavobacterium sp. 270]|nr:hypothetical protein EV144_1011419 [Flavobacterium sp. 270]